MIIPNIDLVVIGSEVLNGFTLDTNTRFITSELFKRGYRMRQSYVIRDDEENILRLLKRLISDSDLVITTGGLGPTQDDLTVDILSKLTNCKPIYDEYARKRAKLIFEKEDQKTGKKINELDPKIVFRQTRIPEKATPLKNRIGIAPGIWFVKPPLLALPGFPVELKSIWPEAIQKIEKLGLKKSHTSIIPIWGLGESLVFSSLKFPKEIEVGVHALDFGCRLFLSSQDQELLHTFSAKVRDKFTAYILQNPLESFIQYLEKEKLNMATVESCTGGLLAKMITDIPGVSRIFRGGMVVYHDKIKESLMGISPEIIERYGAVSRECAFQMAVHGLKKLNSDIVLVTTGIAGPSGGSKEKPVGTVYAGFGNKKEKKIYIGKFLFPFGRERFRKAVASILFLNLYQKYIFFKGEEPWRQKGLGIEFRSFDMEI